MGRGRRVQERGRVPNITQLSEMLGFTDTKALPQMLSSFWSPKFPHNGLADATDEQLAEVAEHFLEENGKNVWSTRGRGLFYPDDKEMHIKPKIFEILKRQRRNQFDVRAKKDREKEPRPSNDLEERVEENDDRGRLTNSRCDIFQLTHGRPS